MTGGVAEPPKFANFEVGPTGHAISPAAPPGVHEDALPPMPSWETATKTRVPTEEHESVEMGDLDPATGQRVPLMGGAAPIARTPSPGVSPISAYGEHPRGGFPAAGAAGAGTLGRGNTGMNRRGPPTDPYGRSIPGDFGTGPTRQGIPRSPYNTNSPNELGPAPLRQGTPYMQYDMNSPNELGSPPMRQGTPQMPYGMSPANELGTEPMRQDTSYLPYGMGSVNELGTEPIRQGTPHNLYDMNTPSELGAEVIAWDGGGNDSYGRNNAVELESPMDPAHNAYGGMANGRGTLNGNDSNQLNDQLNDQGHGHASSPSTRFGNDAGAYRLPGGQMSNGPAQRSGPYQQQFSNQADQSFTPSPSQRQYSNESTRPLMGGSQRRKPVGYSPMPYPEERRGMTSPPPRNDSGFDFGGASSNSGPPLQVPSPFRQQSLSQDHHEPVELPSPDMGYGGGYQGSTAPPSYASRSPPPHQGSRGGNPGYRPYGGPNQNRPQQEW
ncbi:MAG: hypothetical protein M1818_004905 [Claussenomyces sp. TS43310]|nr:MAG: hypothetical protein M1818_004905 [Claussenomyces sp. TS43310]